MSSIYNEEEKEEDKDIEFGDESGDEALHGSDIPKEIRTLRTQVYDKGVSDLIAMIRSKDLVLDPDYQRNYIWDNKKASLLVESLLLNVPIPVIYVAEDEDERWLIVDGLQRLFSLRRFFDNEFKLSGLEILEELNGDQFSTINPKAQRLLKNGILRVIVIKNESHPEIKYDIFQRLNRGSVKLNEQELRNCMYRGRFSELLKDLREYKPYLNALGLEKPHKRFYDAELILRFLALYKAYSFSEGKVIGYPNKMKTFLNRYMEENKKMSEEEAIRLGEVFRNTIDKVTMIFPTPSFRRIKPEDKSIDSRLNRALMDVIMITFAHFNEEFLLGNREEILQIHKELPTVDASFNDALIYGTSDTKKLEYRINTWFKAISEL